MFTLEAIWFPVFLPQRSWHFLPSGASEAEGINVLNPKTHQSPGVSHSGPLAPAVSQTEQKNKRPEQCFRPFADNQMAFLVFHFCYDFFLFNLCGGTEMPQNTSKTNLQIFIEFVLIYNGGKKHYMKFTFFI